MQNLTSECTENICSDLTFTIEDGKKKIPPYSKQRNGNKLGNLGTKKFCLFLVSWCQSVLGVTAAVIISFSKLL